MIELPPSQFRVAEAIRAGASTKDEIAAALGVGEVRLMNVLRYIGDALGVPRAAGRGGKLCDVAGVVDAVRKVDGVVLRESGRGPYQVRDFTPREPPGVSWPDYRQNELRMRA